MYVRDMEKVSAFYARHFGFQELGPKAEGKITLTQGTGGCSIVLLQASKGHKAGQSIVKLVFDVEDVPAFKEEKQKEGLEFGVIHKGPGYEFSNARDPAKNLIQISSSYLMDDAESVESTEA